MRIHMGIVICAAVAAGVSASNIRQTERTKERDQAISRFLVAAGYSGEVKWTQPTAHYHFPATGLRFTEGKATLFPTESNGKTQFSQAQFYPFRKEAPADYPPPDAHLKAAIRAAVALQASDPIKCTFVYHQRLSGEDRAFFTAEAPGWFAKASLAPSSGRVRALYMLQRSK